MDKLNKSGKVYLQPHKAGKKWKLVWLSLFAPSSSGVGRLEVQDLGGGNYGTAGRAQLPHGDRKLVRLSELISVLRLPPNAEACPKENMSAFCVETHERTMVFAAPKDECVDWVEKLCQSTFQRGGASGSTRNQLHMEDNQIYASADEVQASEFWVTVQRTEAAARCSLQGSRWLHVGLEALQLREPHNKDVVREWPYELLRRYGRDGPTLTIEAGRRCDSGPGMFIFETQQAEKIFSLIQSTIKRKTSNVALSSQTPEGAKGAAAKAYSPLPRTPDTAETNYPMESKAKVQTKKSCSLEDFGGDPTAPLESVSVHPAPITLMPLPSVPTHNRSCESPHPEPLDAVYANPGDCIQSELTASLPTALYVDPVGVLPLKPPGPSGTVTPTVTSAPQLCFNIDHPDSGYSEVYDKISPVQSKQKAKGEPIYTEPESKKEATSQMSQTRSNPFAHLYAQVCKTGRSPSPASSCDAALLCAASDVPSTTEGSGQPLDDVIYESLGVI